MPLHSRGRSFDDYGKVLPAGRRTGGGAIGGSDLAEMTE